MNSTEKIISDFIESRHSDAVVLSDYMGNNPELPEQEYEAAARMSQILVEDGFSVEAPFMGIPTAFMGKKKNGSGPKVAIMVEYDALPDIGHACGHNLHGTAALYAGMALSRALADIPGEVWVVGTPAEETDGAKVFMSDEGVFDGVDLALMFHSWSGGVSFTDYRSLALDGYEFTFRGQTSHAAASPWLGRSAQSGVRLFMDAMDMLRLHIRDTLRLHSIITHISGATNIIPDTAVCRVEARAPKRAALNELMDAVFLCAKGAAMATRTEVLHKKFMRSFNDMLPNPVAEQMCCDVLNSMGATCEFLNAGPTGSTDVGNVSYRCPAIQPEFSIAVKPMDLHTREFAAATMTDEGHEAMKKAALGMALTGLRVLTDADLRRRIHEDFRKATAEA